VALTHAGKQWHSTSFDAYVIVHIFSTEKNKKQQKRTYERINKAAAVRLTNFFNNKKKNFF